MNLLIYLGHPAQFYFFKNIIRELEAKGHNIKILLKTKDMLVQLAQEAGLPYTNIQKKVRKNNVLAIGAASFIRTFKVLNIARQYKADLILGTDSSVAQAAKLLGIPGITVLEDDIDIIERMAKLTYPFSEQIVVPAVCRVGKWEAKKVPYQGYMKLAYLHPRRFTPDKDIVKKYIQEDKYCLVRLAQLTAFHDVGIKGLNISLVQRIIALATGLGYRVYISSESKLDESLKAFQLKIRHSDIHHVMSFSSLLLSDSQSMSVEASMLGVPSLRFSSFSRRISVLEELEHNYQLTFGIKTDNPEGLLDKMKSLLSVPNLREEFQTRRKKMLHDKIDVTAFFVWFIENYPTSKEIMKRNPDYQFHFQ